MLLFWAWQTSDQNKYTLFKGITKNWRVLLCPYLWLDLEVTLACIQPQPQHQLQLHLQLQISATARIKWKTLVTNGCGQRSSFDEPSIGPHSRLMEIWVISYVHIVKDPNLIIRTLSLLHWFILLRWGISFTKFAYRESMNPRVKYSWR